MWLSLSQMTLLRQAAWLRNCFRYLFLRVQSLTLHKLVGSQHQKVSVPDLSFQLMHPENRPCWPVWQSSQGRGEGESSQCSLSIRWDALAEFLVSSDLRVFSLTSRFSGVPNSVCACTTPQAFPPFKSSFSDDQHSLQADCAPQVWAALPLSEGQNGFPCHCSTAGNRYHFCPSG